MKSCVLRLFSDCLHSILTTKFQYFFTLLFLHSQVFWIFFSLSHFWCKQYEIILPLEKGTKLQHPKLFFEQTEKRQSVWRVQVRSDHHSHTCLHKVLQSQLFLSIWTVAPIQGNHHKHNYWKKDLTFGRTNQHKLIKTNGKAYFL